MNKEIRDKRLEIRIEGRVIHGDGYGKKLGFPTANIDRRDFVRQKLKLRLGVYSGKVGKYKSGIVIGPLDRNGLPRIEAHLIGFKGNLYGKKIILELGKYLRPFKKYRDEAELRLAIAKDIKKIKSLK